MVIAMTPLELLISQREAQDKSFPLECLLRLYLKCPNPCYVNHMEGFKLLVRWLSPITMPSPNTFAAIPSSLFISYEINQIAIILGTHPKVIWWTIYGLSTSKSVLLSTTYTT